MKKKKKKIIYVEDKGETIYSMAALEGKTPEEVEEEAKRRKNAPLVMASERRAMIKAAFTVYGPLLLICVAAFAAAGLLAFLWLS
ncbi:MAG: hypothetical protein J6U68_04570 [Clostridia bacterium]|nr:hypothetical protein [Clostridia bacterium]